MYPLLPIKQKADNCVCLILEIWVMWIYVFAYRTQNFMHTISFLSSVLFPQVHITNTKKLCTKIVNKIKTIPYIIPYKKIIGMIPKNVHSRILSVSIPYPIVDDVPDSRASGIAKTTRLFARILKIRSRDS